ncbi:MAG: triose-phosphate isomerase [Clostridia bacterium]|nr:triose-phosphate isomerase [Clostridia bacterium]
MKKELRRAVIAGNWKMNMTPSEASAAVEKTAELTAGKDGCDVILCVPFIDIPAAVEAAKGTNVKIGAQNVHFEEKGAYTGEISAKMLLEAGVEYVIIGHSERRQYFGETDTTVNLRTKAALAAGLKVILCLGEVKDERVNGITNEIVSMQTKLDLLGVSAEDMKNVIIAYEPVWAIGTGLTATPEQADETCGVIRAALAEIYGKELAEATTIQYGGSMNNANAAELLAKVNVDGGLIGGASLVPEKFDEIVTAAQAD